MMLNAVILDYQSLAPEDLEMDTLWSVPNIQWAKYDATAAADTAERMTGADIVLTNKVVLDKSLLEKNKQLKLIIILATGTNNVDMMTAKALGIRVCNIVAYSTESVVQHTFSTLLALQSRLLDYDSAVKKGDWSKSVFFGLLDYPIQEIAGKTLGIIGFGAIGRRVKAVAEAFGMNVIVAESLVPHDKKSPASGASSEGRTTLPTLYRQADVISIHSPLSPYSENLVDETAFAHMKKTAVLINVGRGGIVNEKALASALKSGQIKAAATDVLTQEPPAADHVLLDASIPNLIITPHTAWASQEARQALVGQVFDILSAFVTAEDPINTVV